MLNNYFLKPFFFKEVILAKLHKKNLCKVSRPKSFETETRPRLQKTGLETRLKTLSLVCRVKIRERNIIEVCDYVQYFSVVIVIPVLELFVGIWHLTVKVLIYTTHIEKVIATLSSPNVYSTEQNNWQTKIGQKFRLTTAPDQGLKKTESSGVDSGTPVRGHLW